MRVMNEDHPSRPLPDWPFASPYEALMPTTQTSEREGKEGNPFGVVPLVFWRRREEAQVQLMTSLVEKAYLNSIERVEIWASCLLNPVSIIMPVPILHAVHVFRLHCEKYNCGSLNFTYSYGIISISSSTWLTISCFTL